MRNIYIVFFSFIPHFLFSQTGPGGVGNSGNNIMWLDANRLGLTNNATVTTFTDYSGNNNHATQATAANKPLYIVSGINGRAVVKFDGTNDYMQTGAIAALNTNTQTIFSVHTGSGSGTRYVWGTSYTSGASTNSNLLMGHYLGSGNNRVFGRSSTGTEINVSFNGVSGAQMFSSVYSMGASGTMAVNKNGTAGTTATGITAAPAGHNYTRIGASSASLTGFLNGDLAEYIAFSGILNVTQRRIIENYLSSKFGIAFTTTSNDLYTYDGNNGHGYDVIGIGRTSVSDEHLTAKGTGILEISNPSAIPNGGFILIGHDNGTLASTDANVPGTVGTRLTRSWRVQKTGTFTSGSTVTLKFDLTGFELGGFNTDYVFMMDSDNDFTTGATIVTSGVTYNSTTKILEVSGIELPTGTHFTVGHSGKIKSIASGDWSSPSTWNCNCVPQSSSSVEIDSSHTVTVSANSTAKNILIDATASLDVAGSIKLSVKKDLTNNGTLIVNTANLEFNGSTIQTLSSASPLQVYNLLMNSTNGLTLTGSMVTVSNFLSISNGNLTTSGLLTIASTDSATASITRIRGTGNISGNVIVERHFNAAANGWRMLASPVAGDNIESWNEHFPMSGFPGTEDDTMSFKSVTYYVETDTGSANSRYNSPSSTADLIQQGRGYYAYVGGDNGDFDSFTLNVNGTIAVGNVNVAVTNSANGAGAEGWNMIGNPYASPVEFNKITNISSTSNEYWVFDPALGNYRYWQGTPINAGTAGPSIAASQSFWVYVPSGSATLTFTESSKDSINNNAWLKVNNAQSGKRLTMKLTSPVLNGDEASIVIEDGATINQDPFDLAKLFPPDVMAANLYTESGDSKKLSINAIPTSALGASIKIHTTIPVNGNYKLEFKDIPTLDENVCLMLEDKVSGSSYNIRNVNTVNFTGTTTDPTNRFILHIGRPLTVSTKQLTCHNSNDGKISIESDIPYSVKWIDPQGNTVKNSAQVTKDSLTALSAGQYIIVLSSPQNLCGGGQQTIVLDDPNPLTLTDQSSNPACYDTEDGQISIAVQGGNPPYTFQWSNGMNGETITGLAAGNYTVTVKDKTGCSQNHVVSLQSAADLEASFTASTDTIYLNANDTVYFTNNSTGYTWVEWSFGDSSGTISNEPNPDFYFIEPGEYNVTLTAYNDNSCSSTTTRKVVVIDPTSIEDIKSNKPWITSENKTIRIRSHGPFTGRMDVEVFNLLGQTVYFEDDCNLQDKTINLQDIQSNWYLIRIKSADRTFSQKVRID